MKFYRKDVRDANHCELVDHLRTHGYEVIETERPVDCLVFGNGCGWLEIKVPGGNVKRSQLEFIANTRMPVAFATTTDEALNFAKTFEGITDKQKVEVELFLRDTKADAFTFDQMLKVLDGKRLEVLQKRETRKKSVRKST